MGLPLTLTPFHCMACLHTMASEMLTCTNAQLACTAAADPLRQANCQLPDIGNRDA